MNIQNILTVNITQYQKTNTQVEREVGGGIGMGNTCKSMADSQKPLQYCKILSF